MRVSWAGGWARSLMGFMGVAVALAASGCAHHPSAPSTSRLEAGAAIPWVTDYETGMSQAQESGKPMMVEVSTSWCSACKRLDEEVFSRRDVVEAAAPFVPIRVDAEKRRDLEKKFAVSGYPTIVFLTPEGKEIGRVRGAVPYQVMLGQLADAAQKAGG